MIFYFSGTGNSQLAAGQIAQALGDEVVSINEYLKTDAAGDFHSEQPLVFVTPTYAWRMPRLVEEWIGESNFTGNGNAYFVLTCGDSCGNAARYARQLCEKKGFQFCGLAPVVMPENYLAMFPTPNASEADAILERARPKTAELAAVIQSGRPFPAQKVSLVGKLESASVNSLFYRFCVSDKGFWVTEGCISCGKCVQRCPLNNVDLVDAKPVWHGNCTHCMACIGGCPVGAIEYKQNAKGRPRYDRMMDHDKGDN